MCKEHLMCKSATYITTGFGTSVGATMPKVLQSAGSDVPTTEGTGHSFEIPEFLLYTYGT